MGLSHASLSGLTGTCCSCHTLRRLSLGFLDVSVGACPSVTSSDSRPEGPDSPHPTPAVDTSYYTLSLNCFCTQFRNGMSSYCTPFLLSQLLATKAIPARSQQSAVIVDCWRDARAASDLEHAELNIVLTEIALLRACCRVHNDIFGCAFIAFCQCMSLFKRILQSAPFK